MEVTEQDLEQLELYLDHELADQDVRRLDERLAAEPTLSMTLTAFRGQRSQRLAVMSTAYDSDAASVERLVASVRVAQANEAMQRRNFLAWMPSTKSAFTAAACVAGGLLLGVTLQNRHGSTPGGIIASPAANSTSSWLSTDASLQGHGAYVVSLLDANGRELMKVRFYTQEQAKQFIERINNRSANMPAVHVGDARILDEPY